MSSNTNETLSFPEFWFSQHLFLAELSLILGRGHHNCLVRFSSFFLLLVLTSFFLVGGDGGILTSILLVLTFFEVGIIRKEMATSFKICLPAA